MGFILRGCFFGKEKSLNLLDSIQHQLSQALTNLDPISSQALYRDLRLQSPQGLYRLDFKESQALLEPLGSNSPTTPNKLTLCSQSLFPCQGLQLPEALNKLDFKLKHCTGKCSANCHRPYTKLSLILLYANCFYLSTCLIENQIG